MKKTTAFFGFWAVLFAGFLMAGSLTLGGAAGCGSGTTRAGTGDEVDSDDTITVETSSFTSEGEVTGTGALSVTDTDGDGVQDLVMNLGAMVDSDTGSPLDASGLTTDNFEVTETLAASGSLTDGVLSLTLVDTKGQATPLTCTWTPNSSSTEQPLDVFFVLDTTGSMGAKIGSMTSSLSDFFDDLVSGGTDIRAGGIVYGDAFNTKLASGSAYSVGTGSDEPPSFDTDERPFLDLITPVSGDSNDNMDTFLSEIDADCGAFGCGGGDLPENTVGSLDYSNLNGNFRDGALRTFLVFGDNDAHSDTTFESDIAPTEDTWTPRALASVQDSLSTAGASVFAIRTDTSESESGDYINLSDLVTGGGTSIDLPSGDIDLNTLNLVEFLTAGGQLVCGGTLRCTNMNCILRILQGSETRGTWTWNVTFGGCD